MIFSKKTSFILIFIFWALILGIFIVQKEYTLRAGTEILLKTTPVDPRDLFRGDYVILSYDISRVELPPDSNLKEGEKVYVLLKKGERYHEFEKINSALEKEEDKVSLKGSIKRINGNKAQIEYGIESYFVPEGKGWEIQNLRGEKAPDVLVSVGRSGRAVIKELLLDGKPVNFDAIKKSDRGRW